MSKDLKADLELCNKATPGPWYREKTGANFKGFSSEVIIADTSRYTTGNKVYAEPEGGQFPSSDADFIAQAQEGWPYAIKQALAEKERADKYEDLVRELLYAVDTAWRLASDYKMEVKCGVAVTSGYTEREQYRLISDIVRRAKEVLGDE